MNQRLHRAGMWVLAVTGALTLGAWLALRIGGYPADLQAAQARLAGSELVQTPCGLIEYRAVGEGAAVLVAHGAGGGFDQSLDFAGPLALRGLKIIGVSRFGYLRSPLPEEASAEQQADTYVCLMDALGLERASIIGASAGAPSALQFALRHPERAEKLALLVPALYTPKDPGAPVLDIPPGVPTVVGTLLQSDLLYWTLSKVAPRLLIGTILGTPPEQFDQAEHAEQARVRTMISHILPVSARRNGLMNDARVITNMPRYELERVNTPTLALSVADDRYGTYAAAKYTADHIAGARFVGYPAGGHIWIGHHAEALTAIGDFLSGG